VEIRQFRSADRRGCRSLYAQLVQHHREIYDDPRIGGDDPGAGFDEYVALPQRVATWVAVEGDELVGMTGLLWEADEATIEPVVVHPDHRRTGIGRALVETAVAESRRRGATDVNIRPVARNAAAIRAFHELGFRTLGHVQLFISLERDPSYWRPGPTVHGCAFDL
jgi:GNAT superfamily N-acetyltransferase